MLSHYLVIITHTHPFPSPSHTPLKKSEEEIEKLTIDETLTDMERACLLIATGQDVQKMFVIEHLPDLLRHQQMEALCRVLPKICVSDLFSTVWLGSFL